MADSKKSVHHIVDALHLSEVRNMGDKLLPFWSKIGLHLAFVVRFGFQIGKIGNDLDVLPHREGAERFQAKAFRDRSDLVRMIDAEGDCGFV